MSTPDATLFVLDADPKAASAVQGGLAASGLRLVGSEARVEHALDAVKASRPDVIVLDVTACGDLPSTVRTLLLASSNSCVIVTGAGTSPNLMSRAVAAGARGFLLKPYSPHEFFDTAAEALGVARALVEAKTARRPGRASGKLLAVYSPKGGVGCTTIATNLAVALSARPKTSVALIDLDLQFGDVGAALDLHSVNTVAEMLKIEAITAELIDETFVRHESGVRALLAPDDLNVVDTIETEQVLRLLEGIRPHFDYIVCDLWSSLDPLTKNVMRVADRVLLVTTPEFPALRDLQRVLSSTRADLHLDHRTSVIVNRFPGKAGLPIAQMAKALGLPISATIPSEGITVTDAINRGLSLLDSRAKVRLARSYHQLAALAADPMKSDASAGSEMSRVVVSR